MRLIHFEKYDKNAIPVGTQAQAWQILWMAVNDYPAGNKEQTALGHQVFLALRDASQLAGQNRYLDPEGADIYFEDAEFRLLDQAVQKFRENIRLAGAEALIWIDKQLEKAPEIAKDAYKAGQRLKD